MEKDKSGKEWVLEIDDKELSEDGCMMLRMLSEACSCIKDEDGYLLCARGTDLVGVLRVMMLIVSCGGIDDASAFRLSYGFDTVDTCSPFVVFSSDDRIFTVKLGYVAGGEGWIDDGKNILWHGPGVKGKDKIDEAWYGTSPSRGRWRDAAYIDLNDNDAVDDWIRFDRDWRDFSEKVFYNWLREGHGFMAFVARMLHDEMMVTRAKVDDIRTMLQDVSSILGR